MSVADAALEWGVDPPDQAAAGVRDAGFALVGLFALEGPGAFLPDFPALE
jgi:hypothetical protein